MSSLLASFPTLPALSLLFLPWELMDYVMLGVTQGGERKVLFPSHSPAVPL